MAAVAIITVIVLAILLSPKAAPDETVVVLPSADGHIGTVVVQRGASRQVLNQPYAASRAVGGAQPELTRLSAAEVRQSFGAALDALPPRPATFALYFVTGTDELTEPSREELRKVLAALGERKVPDVLVIGHTDTVGESGANDRLSSQRAETVKGFLVGAGIAAARIQTAGRGEREPLVSTADNVDEPRNRRVEINVR